MTARTQAALATTLARLAASCSASKGCERNIQRALADLRRVTRATEAWVIVPSEHAGQLACVGRSSRLWGAGFTPEGLWLLQRWMLDEGCHVGFHLRRADGYVLEKAPARPRLRRSYFAFRLTVGENSAEMLVLRGPWKRRGIPASTLTAIEATLPAFSVLVGRHVDDRHTVRLQRQLDALGDVAKVLAGGQNLEAVLTELAGFTSATTSFEFVTIDLYSDDLSRIEVRCLADNRYASFESSDKWRRAKDKGDPVGKVVLQLGHPLYIPDLQTDPRVPESSHAFARTNMLRSTAIVPLTFRDQRLGVLSLTGFRMHDFDEDEVRLIETLAAQTATAVRAVTMYSELQSSERKLRDLNEMLQENMEVQHWLARTDTLTGLPNRRQLEEAIGAEVARAQRHGNRLSVALVDVDNFKDVNDQRGHPVGDEVLRAIASLARQAARESDMVGRYGGDEFLFILPETGADGATELIRRFAEVVAGQQFEPKVSISGGVAEFIPGEDYQSLIAYADTALYEAKRLGRNRVCVWQGVHAIRKAG